MKLNDVKVPDLDHDKMMREKFNHKVSGGGRMERRVAAFLLHYLAEAGFRPAFLDDGDGRTKIEGENLVKATMELVFNLDECWILFEEEGVKSERYAAVRIILGNGCPLDLVCDWTISNKKFADAMESFLKEID